MSDGSAAVRGARRALDLARWAHYDRWHRQQAMAALKVMERTNGRPLTPALRRECDAYARRHLGSRVYAPWLYFYAATQQEFREGWLPDNYYGRWVVPRASNGLGALAAAKTLTRRTLHTSAVPDLGYLIDGLLYDRDMRIVSVSDLCDAIADAHPRVFVKSDGSSQGRAVRPMSIDDLRSGALARLPNSVIQAAVRQHPDFDAISVDAVATLRVTTVKEADGTIGPRGTNLKVGYAGASHVASGNHIAVAVVSADGDLQAHGYGRSWDLLRAHPDTGARFEGWRVPAYRDAVALCQRLHAGFPHFGIVGWDVTVDDRGGVVVLEWNAGHTGIKFAEATTGPWFADLGWDRLHLRGQ